MVMTEETAMTRILFVDDEPNVLHGLKRMLRSQRNIWEMDFAESGEEALEKMREVQFDIVVSDMCMPSLNGVQLLNKVKELYPRMARFILSGHADKEMLIKSVGPTHQFLAKPCDPEILKGAVQRAVDMRDLLKGSTGQVVIKDTPSLSTLPELYKSLIVQLNSSANNPSDIADIISRDVAMTAKILQLVNSAFFGLKREVNSVSQAVSLLGVKIINSVITTVGVFDMFDEKVVERFNIRDIYRHSVTVGSYASKLIQFKLKDKKAADKAVLAGMTHDFGKLVMINQNNEEWNRTYDTHLNEKRPLHNLEQETIGIGHGEIGAYLLSLWGFSYEIIEAVAFHHEPSKGNSKDLSTMAAVHLANHFEHIKSGTEFASPVGRAYVEQIGLTEDEFNEMKSLCIDQDGDE